MIIDESKIAEWRVKLLEVLLESRDPGDLIKDLFPELGQLLALANAAVTIRTAYKHEDDGALAHQFRMSGALIGTMRGLDELEEAAMKAEGVVPLRPRRKL